MAERYDILIKVTSVKGECPRGHKVGDQWIENGYTPAGICVPAFVSLVSYIRALGLGGSFSWSKDPNAVPVACPDPDNAVAFEVRRIRK